MKYLLFICGDQDVELTPEEEAGMGPATEAWVQEWDSKGVRLDGNRLRPPGEATTVRVRGDEVLLGDGPFAETKELIAGYDILECASLDEAIRVAAGHPVARFGSIEVRPYWEE